MSNGADNTDVEDGPLVRLVFATYAGRNDCIQALLADALFLRDLCAPKTQTQTHTHRLRTSSGDAPPFAPPLAPSPLRPRSLSLHRTAPNTDDRLSAHPTASPHSPYPSSSPSSLSSSPLSLPSPHSSLPSSPHSRRQPQSQSQSQPQPQSLRHPHPLAPPPHSPDCGMCRALRLPLNAADASFCLQTVRHPAVRPAYLKILREQDAFHSWGQLHWAVVFGLNDYVYSLLKNPHFDVHVVDCKQRNAAHIAVLFGQTALVGMLRAFGVNMCARDDRQRSILHYSTIVGDAQSCWIILRDDQDKGACEDASDPKTTSRTNSFIDRPTSGIRRRVIDPNATDDLGRTPLHYLFVSTKKEIKHVNSCDEYSGCGGQVKFHCLTFLLQKGASILRKDDSRFTPLDYAARLGLMGAVHMMIQKGILQSVMQSSGDNPNNKQRERLSDTSSQSSLDEKPPVVGQVREEWAQKLGCGCDDQSQYWEQLMEMDHWRSDMLLNNHSTAPQSFHDDVLWSPYHLAAKYGHARCIYLLALTSYPGFLNQDGHKRSPLHYAASGNHIDSLNLLLQLGVSPSLKDVDGRYASQLSKSTECTDVLEHARSMKKKKKSKSSQMQLLSRESSVSAVSDGQDTRETSISVPEESNYSASCRQSPSDSLDESIEELLDLATLSLDRSTDATPPTKAPAPPTVRTVPSNTPAPARHPESAPFQFAQPLPPSSMTSAGLMRKKSAGREHPMVPRPPEAVHYLPALSQPRVRAPFTVLPPIAAPPNSKA